MQISAYSKAFIYLRACLYFYLFSPLIVKDIEENFSEIYQEQIWKEEDVVSTRILAEWDKMWSSPTNLQCYVLLQARISVQSLKDMFT